MEAFPAKYTPSNRTSPAAKSSRACFVATLSTYILIARLSVAARQASLKASV